MTKYYLQINLLSDTTFGRGDGVAGLIDQEVEHDAYGFPYLKGRTLKGLLSEEWDNILSVLPPNSWQYWQTLANQLFGTLGSTLGTMGIVHFGDAYLPSDLRQVFAYQIDQGNITKTEVLESLTAIRRQNSIDNTTGVSDQGSLRSYRVIIRDLCFTADLIFEENTANIESMLSLLAISALGLRYLGSGRNRGRGHVKCCLCDSKGNDITQKYFNHFIEMKEKIA